MGVQGLEEEALLGQGWAEGGVWGQLWSLQPCSYRLPTPLHKGWVLPYVLSYLPASPPLGKQDA